jgi:hypothetical protein
VQVERTPRAPPVARALLARRLRLGLQHALPQQQLVHGARVELAQDAHQPALRLARQRRRLRGADGRCRLLRQHLAVGGCEAGATSGAHNAASAELLLRWSRASRPRGHASHARQCVAGRLLRASCDAAGAKDRCACCRSPQPFEPATLLSHKFLGRQGTEHAAAILHTVLCGTPP